ncbi:regulatory protein RecX [Sedimenticola thiotaurini]|uniref:regulatory protein RecX n=1 Tax=Sedimenticola thiotaurini TaxID=1543721 RepID=UPI001F3A258F|nr:regulatory protein RecX [Sedimenticola thiotaurini]
MSEQLELEQAAVRLLAAREHSRAELRRKLHARCETPALLEQVLDGLEQRGYLSDARYVEQYVSSRKRKGFGPVRIRQELQERGVSADLIEPATDPGEQEWRELIRQCCQRKFGDARPSDYRERAKRARFLEYRGFPSEMIRDLLWDGID